LAIVFIVIIFFIKNKNLFEGTVKYFSGSGKAGLTYNPNETVGDLLNKSTTGDGIPDWEKVLLGLDPTKTENVPGVPDSVTIAKMMQANGGSGTTITDDSKLSQTDQVSREFFATVASLQESGAIDANGNMSQATQDQITNSLINNIQNSPQRKIYQLSDIKIVNDNSVSAVKKYNNALNNVFPKTPIKNSVADILQKFAPDDTGNNADPSVLSELNPIIKQMTDSLNGMLAAPVPQALATLHLYMINYTEGMIENLNDVQQYNTDPIVAFSGMNKYEQNSDLFTQVTQYIAALIDMKLNMK
jgi:hypothetical protein